MQTLLQNDESDGVYIDNSHINAKFKFWVKSKGFQVGTNVLGEHNKKGAPGKPVLYVPVKSTVKCVCVCVCARVCVHVWHRENVRVHAHEVSRRRLGSKLSLYQAALTRPPHE